MEELASAMTTRWLERAGERRDLPVSAADLPEQYAGLAPSEGGSLDQALRELDRFVGLTSVKQQVEGMVARLRHEQKRHRQGAPAGPAGLDHMLFTGPPGTGKTTVADVLGKVLHDLGLLARGHVYPVTRTDLVGRYLGQTSPRVREAVDRAMGGILFVDEAYNLMSGRDDQYGREATTALLEEMERHRGRFVVVAAGYPDLIDRWIGANDGLRSRFPVRLKFPPFTLDELVEILRRMAADLGYDLPAPAARRAEAWFDRASWQAGPQFGNAREARSLLEMMITRLARRTADATDLARLSTFAPEDVPDAGR
jgi:SpoVK/Ycf46/Vps4 family AAA+-type ATPase